MRLDKFTVKAGEAVADAQVLAAKYGHQNVETYHLLEALMNQEGGIISPILDKLGINSYDMKKELEKHIKSKPTISSGGGSYISTDFSQVLNNALEESQQMKDEYVSVEIP